MHEAIDERDDAGGVGENLVPLTEGFIGYYQRTAQLVTTRSYLEQQVRVACVISQIAHLVHAE